MLSILALFILLLPGLLYGVFMIILDKYETKEKDKNDVCSRKN